MHLLSDLAELRRRDLEHEIQRGRLARLAGCHRACCNPTLVDRLARAIGVTPAGC